MQTNLRKSRKATNNVTGAFLLSLLSSIWLSGCGSPVIERQTDAFTFLNNKISSWVEAGYYDGAAVMIVQKDKELFRAMYGGYTDTTVLHVASAGKWIAAATIAAVVDEGSMSWDDPVKKYLPQFKDDKGNATLRQLLSHTAGYPDYQPENARRDDYQTLEEAVSHILPLPADTLPGTEFSYGGLAMQVAGRMAEIAIGKDLETLFRVKIARPLQMNRSHFTPVSTEPGFNPMLGGGFYTCLRDYLRFLEMILNEGEFRGERILSATAIREIEADQVKQAKVNQPEYVLNARQNAHTGIYGLGVWREEIDEHGDATLISSPGWAGAYPWVDRKNDVYGFILAKTDERKVNEDGFSSFYGSAVLPLIVRDALHESDYPQWLKTGYVETAPNVKLYYQEAGQGEPLIFIHGHSLTHRMWDEQFWVFARDYRVVRYDLRGYGYSSDQTETEQFTHVDDLVELMDQLNIAKAHIVGLSLGGYIGADLLGVYSDRILSATLASGNVRLLPKPSRPMDAGETARRDEEIIALKNKGLDVMKREWFDGLMNSAGSLKERMRISLWSMIYEWSAWQPLHKEVRVVAGEDAYDKLRTNRPDIPVLILEGRSENNRFPENPDILRYLPCGEMEIIEDAGHMMNMEQPEKFNETLLKFLK